MVCKGNPFKDDPVIVALLKELDSIVTRRQFRRWKKSVLLAFEAFLEEEGCIQVRAAYRELCQILSRHVALVKKMHAHIQMGDMSPDGCTVKSRQTLGDFFDQMIRVKQILIDLLPTTAKMEKKIGYTKFHLAAVLIDNGFVAYDRLSLCDEIHFHFKKWCLQDVTSQLFLLEMDHYHTQLDIFCDILADVGLNHAMEVCIKFLHLDDEETISWEDDDEPTSNDGASLSSSEEEDDMDPLPDLSDITFDDEASLNLPLWKVHNFYVDNAEMAEAFRHDMKRKSFEMFSASNHSRDVKPPSKPLRSRDASPPPPPSPVKPVRRSSIGNDEENKNTETLTTSIDAGTKEKTRMDRTERASNRTMQTSTTLSDSDSSGDESGSRSSSNDRRSALQRADTARFVLPTNYLAMPTSSKLRAVEPSPEDCEEGVDGGSQRPKYEDTPAKSFYSFANYYHGNPTEWRISKK